MPIHIVPLVVGGTIAVVGTGYAFKKFVYDPHLAPAIEAFFATRHTSSSTESYRLNEPISARTNARDEPISVRSTARDRLNGARGFLRRRGRAADRNEDGDGEENVSLLGEAEGRRTPTPTMTGQHVSGGLVSDLPEYEMDQHFRSNIPKPAGSGRPVQVRSSSDRPKPQDDEIRSIIFNTPPPQQEYRPTSSLSSETSGLILTGAGTTTLIPTPTLDTLHSPADVGPAHLGDPSTTFSFLSLSQVSSPEPPLVNLDTMSFSHFNTYTPDARTEEEDTGARDEVLSLPDTSMSGYESGEMISALSSPRYGLRTSRDVMEAGSGDGELGLGLNTVGDVGMAYMSPTRKSGSVISLSESGSGSDWEALSEARAGSS